MVTPHKLLAGRAAGVFQPYAHVSICIRKTYTGSLMKCSFYWNVSYSNTHLSFILLVRSTASMSMRILYLTCGGTLVVQGYMSAKTSPAQNLFFSSRCKAWWVICDSSVNAANLSRSRHYNRRRESSGSERETTFVDIYIFVDIWSGTP